MCIAPMQIVQPVVQPLQPVDRQEHVSFHISTLNKHTKPESRQNSIPLNLLAYIPDQEAARQPPNPKPRASKRAHLRLWRANRGEGRSIFHKAGLRTQGLAKVNNSTSRPIIDGTVPFYTVNRCQTVVERSNQITKDLQHPRITEECLPLILHHLVFDSL